MKKLTAILDAVSIFSLILLSLTLLINMWEIIDLLLLAILVGTIVHLLRSYGDAFALLFVAYLWVAIAMDPPRGVPWEPTAWKWTLAIIVNFSFFSCPVVYFFWIRKLRYRTYFKACAWIYILGFWVLILSIPISIYRPDAPLEVSFVDFLDGSALILLLVPVSVYLTYRLIMGTLGARRPPAEVASG